MLLYALRRSSGYHTRVLYVNMSMYLVFVPNLEVTLYYICYFAAM
jgi:hypothetical protein